MAAIVCYTLAMPKGDNLSKVRPPAAARAKALGVTLLASNEVYRKVHIRTTWQVMAQFMALSASERGEVVALGLKARAKGE